ncbi:MAG: bifunctional 23S rRNA (guanine(2069)-N(7))-methyltransferase RlmK/23S rRNA (guanine(2445)-N(2))-methyltransferase RlmL [Planctomycetia bacterium]|nr:bifunctional 23S rRNA (guanine(2069)-N(7))-methyltransferase RlmK/23S rRNA (guanine(2445)-N(2))-methyltransferase RlmL [Planctomycetia bacterium]
MPLELIATSMMGLEAIVSRELTEMGYSAKNIDVGRTLFCGEKRDICRANIHLRCAGRVLVRMAEFYAADFGTLFDVVESLPWEEWIPKNGAFPVTGRSLKSQLSSVPACQKIVKKAIVTRLEKAYGGFLLEDGAKFPVEVSLVKDRATITLDTSGTGLHRRGYRHLVGSAPLRETLAAAMILLSYWNPERPMIDPFCGSGTIPIEAAMIGRKIAPGINREFISQTWPAIPEAYWREIREEAQEAILPGLPQRILGTDIDENALSMARYHAQRAGVAEDIHFQQRDFHDLTSSRQYGCTIMNPPYGKWIGEDAQVRRLYEAIPYVLRRLPTWSHYIITPYPDFERMLGQKADRRRKMYNSRLECTFYQFFGPKPPRKKQRAEDDGAQKADVSGLSDETGRMGRFSEELKPAERVSAEGGGAECISEEISAERVSKKGVTGAEKNLLREKKQGNPVFGGLSESAKRSAQDFEKRLMKMAHHLRRFPTRRKITCYRIYDRDIPEIPLAVDRYEDYLHVAEYDRPHERTVAQQADWMDWMMQVISRALETPREKIFLKQRRRQKGNEQYERYDTRNFVIDAHEGGLTFLVNLSDYLDTGLFLDHRITRDMVRKEAAGKRVLNLFAYTGSFSVYAADGGAKSVTTVDLSKTYLEWAEANMELNGFRNPGFRNGADCKYQYIRDDVIPFLYDLSEDVFFDLVVADPPTFSNSKTTEYDWDVQRNHVEMLNLILRHLKPGGVIYFSNNSRRFKLEEAAISDCFIREISARTVPEDFRNKRIHRCWRMVKNKEEEKKD